VSSAVPLKCRCGKIRGSVAPASPSVGHRVVCMCIDCQTYAHWLGEEAQLLDDVGGTDIYQTTPSRIRIDEGQDQIRCFRLSPKGTLRFYAGCCRTPLANMTAAAGVPFAGIPHAFMDHADKTRDEALGPIKARYNANDATGPAPAGSQATISKLTMARAGMGLLWDRIRGLHQPNPFRDAQGQPVAKPDVVSKDERNSLRARCGPQR